MLCVACIIAAAIALSVSRFHRNDLGFWHASARPTARLLITHVLSPFTAHPQSFVAFQQQVVARSIAAALQAAREAGIGVEIFGITTPAEQSAVLPPLTPLPLLNRTLADVLSGAKGLGDARLFTSLPILRDILNVAHERGRGRFLVYTNADIAVQRDFYVAIRERYLLRGGGGGGGGDDAPFVLLRRTLAASLTSLADMYRHANSTALSKGHAGDDCFVFPRAWVPKLRIGDVALGHPPVGYLLSANLRRLHALFARHDAMLTFHVGDEQAWARNRDAKPHYAVYQFVQAARAAATDRVAGEPDWRSDLVQGFLVEPFAGLCLCAWSPQAAQAPCARQWRTMVAEVQEACRIHSSLRSSA